MLILLRFVRCMIVCCTRFLYKLYLTYGVYIFLEDFYLYVFLILCLCPLFKYIYTVYSSKSSPVILRTGGVVV